MPVKAKRGLGLLAVAAIGYLLVNAAHESDGSGGVETALEVVGWLLAGVGLIGGLALLAWGLLRD